MRKISRYIKPKSMSYLRKRHLAGKNMGFLLLNIFLWMYVVLQEHMSLYVAVVMTITFILMARYNSKLLATLTLLSVLGIFYLPEAFKYLAIGMFSGVLFIGMILIVGGPKRTVTIGYGSGYISDYD